tara:strand:+ start:680 stop:1048 length:369 start_codon:yes stop_codon:yes gene_type:complete
MLLKPVCVNYEHEIFIHEYLELVISSIEIITKNDEKYKDFIDVSNIIIEHHNNYKSDALNFANYQDFLSLIPTHFSCMVNGYLTGIENEENKHSVRVYKELLSQAGYRLIEKIETIKIEEDI